VSLSRQYGRADERIFALICGQLRLLHLAQSYQAGVGYFAYLKSAHWHRKRRGRYGRISLNTPPAAGIHV